eukprot:363062-Chlamydomonas_euryale.AAC.17
MPPTVKPTGTANPHGKKSNAKQTVAPSPGLIAMQQQPSLHACQTPHSCKRYSAHPHLHQFHTQTLFYLPSHAHALTDPGSC